MFVQGMTASAALGAAGLRPTRVLAQAERQPELSGTEFDLEISELSVN